jgi:hypothetical protein
MRKGWMVLVVLLGVLGAAVALWRPRSPAPQLTTSTAPAPRILTSGVVEAAEVHAQLLAAAQDMPEPTMAGAVALVPGQAQVAAVAALEESPQQPLTTVPPEQELVIGFTGNVVGETDPCG